MTEETKYDPDGHWEDEFGHHHFDQQRFYEYWRSMWALLPKEQTVSVPETSIWQDIDKLINWARRFSLDYFAWRDRVEEILKELQEEIDKLNKRDIITSDTNTIDITKNGDWQNGDDEIKISADVKISKLKNNSITALSDGIFAEESAQSENEKIKYLDSKLNNDETDIQGKEFVLSPYLPRNAVMQSLYYDETEGYFYFVQADVSTPEGFVVTKTTQSGKYISNMWIKGGGHGANTFFRKINNTLFIYYLHEQDYYYFGYADNSTVNGDSGAKAFTIPYGKNGMVAMNNNYMSHIDGDHILYIYTLETNGNNFIFGTSYLSIDTSQQFNSDLLQGIAIIKKENITGITSDSVLVVVSTGTPNVSSNFNIYELDPIKNTFKFLLTINNMSNIVSTSETFETYETEGLATINLNSNYDSFSGIIYGVSAGVQGQRKQFVYGLLNNTLSTYFANLRSSEFQNYNPKYVDKNTTMLTDYTQAGTYELKASDTLTILDFPWTWRGVATGSDWTLEVTQPNQYGDVIQSLKRRGVKSQMEIYERTLDFNTDTGYGENYKPKTIGWWNLISLSGVKANDLYGGNSTKFTKLSDFSTPGQNYYVSSSALNKITDFEGLKDIIGSAGFKISVANAGGSSDIVIQTVEILKDYGVTMLKRTLHGTPDTYGPKLIVDTTKNDKWVQFTGTVVS